MERCDSVRRLLRAFSEGEESTSVLVAEERRFFRRDLSLRDGDDFSGVTIGVNVVDRPCVDIYSIRCTDLMITFLVSYI